MLKLLWLSGLVIIADQLSKWLAESQLVAHQAVQVLPWFDWYLTYNTGAAFSFLANAGGWQRWFFAVLAMIISVVLIIWIKKLNADEKATGISLSLILGGAIGNLIDRVYLGHVIDFVQIWLGNYAWPAFNIADSAISLGAAILIISSIAETFSGKHEQDKA